MKFSMIINNHRILYKILFVLFWGWGMAQMPMDFVEVYSLPQLLWG